MKLLNPSHSTAFSLLKLIRDNPAQNMTRVAALAEMPTSRLCTYMDAFDRFKWVDKQSNAQQKLLVITDKGRIALIALECLITNEIPEGVEIIEDLD